MTSRSMHVSSDAELQGLSGNTALRELHVARGATEAGLRHLRGLFRLERLDFHEIPITGDGLKHLERMRELRWLSLFGCAITDEAMAHLPTLPMLADLNLNSTRVTDSAVERLARLPRLKALELGQARLTGPGLAALAGLKRLRTLNLYQSGITDDGLRCVRDLPPLERLDLGWTAITDAGLAHLAELNGLGGVRLESTKVTDAGISSLAKCRSLTWVNLDHTAVTMAGINLLKEALPECALSARGSAAANLADERLELIERPEDRAAAPVAESWRRIEAWLVVHQPDILATLRPPASEALIRRVEATIGQRLPQSLSESYLIHDGQNCWVEEDVYVPGVLFGMRLRPLVDDEGVEWLWKHGTADSPDMFDENSPDVADYKSYPAGAVRRARMRAGWIPLYWDCGRDYFGIDLDPGPNGVAGQVIPFSYGFDIGAEEKPVVALSWGHFLEDIADELEAGHAGSLPPELGESGFYLKGSQNRFVWNAIPAWSKAKLPRTFQEHG